jgi:hypothetical protein
VINRRRTGLTNWFRRLAYDALYWHLVSRRYPHLYQEHSHVWQ